MSQRTTATASKSSSTSLYAPSVNQYPAPWTGAAYTQMQSQSQSQSQSQTQGTGFGYGSRSARQIPAQPAQRPATNTSSSSSSYYHQQYGHGNNATPQYPCSASHAHGSYVHHVHGPEGGFHAAERFVDGYASGASYPNVNVNVNVNVMAQYSQSSQMWTAGQTQRQSQSQSQSQSQTSPVAAAAANMVQSSHYVGPGVGVEYTTSPGMSGVAPKTIASAGSNHATSSAWSKPFSSPEQSNGHAVVNGGRSGGSGAEYTVPCPYNCGTVLTGVHAVGNMTRHLKSQNCVGSGKDKPRYICPVEGCDKRYIRSDGLKVHLRKRHNIAHTSDSNGSPGCDETEYRYG